jgi:hypothetical protein
VHSNDIDYQVFTPKAAAIFVATGIGLYFYFQYEKAKVHEQRRTSGHRATPKSKLSWRMS